MLEFAVDGRSRRCPVWLPPDYDPQRTWPLLVFLHAYEERGDDLEHLAVGIGPVLEERGDAFPCIVLLPQCPRDAVWSIVDRPWADGCDSAESHIDAAIDAALARLPVDPQRVALTGASMGGYGTFVYGAKRRERFRAFGPVCGGGDPASARALCDSAVWVMHGTADDVVPISESDTMVDAIRAANGTGDLRFSRIPDAGHDVWDHTYRDGDFVSFLVD